MMHDLWTIEHRLWLDGAEAYADLMAPRCVMAFAPMGILQDQAIVDSLRGAPRWTFVEMTGQVLARPMPDLAILAYRARARRDGADPYAALCTSTYLRLGERWRIAQHQQTPLA
jgi:hypothetical protein